MKLNYLFVKIIGLLLILVHLNSCGFYRPVSAKDYPPEPEKRVQKNIQEGRGFTLMGAANNKKGGEFSFASSNEMWRASLDILDFMPLTSADYGGGLIITDWYGEENTNDEIKITIQFLSNEVRSDALSIKVFKKKCTNLSNCKVIESQSDIDQELKVAILKRAAKYKTSDFEKKNKGREIRVKEYRN